MSADNLSMNSMVTKLKKLFVKSKNEKIDLYTRMCPFSLSERRQPIILTKEERDKIPDFDKYLKFEQS